jgi:hypothetical protein
VPINSCNFLYVARRQVPDVKVPSAAGEEDLIALWMEELRCSDRGVFDVYGCEEWIGSWMCSGLDVVEVECRCRARR